MIQITRNCLLTLLLLTGFCQAESGAVAPQLPSWQVLEYEEHAYWTTARSRIEILPSADDEALWELTADSSVSRNSEHVVLRFDPATGNLRSRERLSIGSQRRFKVYQYDDTQVQRRRYDPGANPEAPPHEWPPSNKKRRLLPYPQAIQGQVVTNSYLLLLLAGRLQTQGPGATTQVFVHTDLNFYRVELVCVEGVSVPTNYKVTGGKRSRGKRDTVAVVLRLYPEGPQPESHDFSLLGMARDIVILFDKVTGLPLQVRGKAPKIGVSHINLRSTTMRQQQP